jgi:hypothetical protein
MGLRPLIYIAGPMALGSMADNIRQAWEAAEKLRDAGFSPIVPHDSFFNSITGKRRSHAEWLEIDKPMVLASAAVLRLPGESVGADQEVEWARENGKSVWFDVDALVQWGSLFALDYNGVVRSLELGHKILAEGVMREQLAEWEAVDPSDPEDHPDLGGDEPAPISGDHIITDPSS